MATRQARVLTRTSRLNDEETGIVFDPAFRAAPESGYWLELALASSDIDLAKVAGRLGPLSGAQADIEKLDDWRGYQALVLGVLHGLLKTRPDLLRVASEELRDRARMVFQEQVPHWPSLHDAATALIKSGQVVISSLSPLVFDADARTGIVLANALNEAMHANELCSCVVCGTPYSTSARPRQYCSPACRKAAAVAPKGDSE